MRKVLDCFALLIALVLIFPLVYALFGAFRTGAEFAAFPPRLLPDSFANFENFKTVFTRVPMPRYMRNSLITSLLTATVKLAVSALAAYAFWRWEFRGKTFLFMLLLGTMMLPADTLIITNYRTVSRLRLTDTYLGICIISFVGASQMFMLRQQFTSIPAELRDAAYMDGCSDIRFLLSVLLPLCRGVMATLFLQSFIAQWNSYLWPLLVTGRDEMRTVQVGLSMLTDYETANYEVVLAGACAALVPGLILFFLSRSRITGAVTTGAVVE